MYAVHFGRIPAAHTFAVLHVRCVSSCPHAHFNSHCSYFVRKGWERL